MQIFATDANVVSDDEINDIIASYETNYEYTSSDLFLFDSEIEMSEIVDGNVFAYGSSVSITGEIYGDLFVFANSLNIAENAMIYGNVLSLIHISISTGIALFNSYLGKEVNLSHCKVLVISEKLASKRN